LMRHDSVPQRAQRLSSRSLGLGSSGILKKENARFSFGYFCKCVRLSSAVYYRPFKFYF